MKSRIRVLVLLSCIAVSCVSTVNEIEGKYGTSFNPSRQKHGIPLVTRHMVLREDIDRKRYLFSEPNRDRSRPGHWWKELLTDSLLKLKLEKDFFYNPDTEAWLLCESIP